jgi:hypothetical protein
VSFRYETVPALELNRSHIGQTVQVTTEEFTIVGRLNRVDNEDNLDFPEFASPMDAIRMLQARDKLGIRREIRCWLTIGPWRGEIYPAQAVVVEYEETPEIVQGTLVEVSLVEPGRGLPGAFLELEEGEGH